MNEFSVDTQKGRSELGSGSVEKNMHKVTSYTADWVLLTAKDRVHHMQMAIQQFTRLGPTNRG